MADFHGNRKRITKGGGMTSDWERYDADELLRLVSQISDKYTEGESTSVPYETANALMSHALYCLGQSGEDNALALKEGLKDIYKSGLEAVQEKTGQAFREYQLLKENFDGYGLFNLESEIGITFRNFFSEYNPSFFSGDDPVEFLYPVLGNPETLHGIDAVMTRLNCIKAEMGFLSSFEREKVIKILSETTKSSPGHPAYMDFYGSAAYEVLKRMVLCYITWRPMEVSLPELIKELNGVKDNIDPVKDIPDAVHAITRRFSDPLITGYLELGIKPMTGRMQKALELGKMEVIAYG